MLIHPDLLWFIVCFSLAIVGAAVYGFLSRNGEAAQLEPAATPAGGVARAPVEAVQMATIAMALLGYVTYRCTNASSSEDCAICLGQFDDGELCSVMPVCRHEFHRDCIANWLSAYNNTCPLCRAELQWLAVARDMV